jgi:N-acetylglutamate synthase
MDQIPSGRAQAALRRARAGERWVIRQRLPDGSATDVTGWLDVVDVDAVEVTTDREPRRRIVLADVIMARRAPSARGGPDPFRTSATELEHIALPGWLARHEPLGEWTLRAAGGFTGRANSCLAVGDPGVAYHAAEQRIRAFSGQHGIPPWAQVVTGSPEEQELAERGWQPTYVPTDVLVARLADFLGSTLPEPAVQVSEQLEDSWLRAYHESRPNEADPELLRMILDGQPPRAFASADDAGQVFAIARGHVNRDWLGLASIWTRADHRRRGWGRTLMITLGHWAARRGARYVYLQVASANAGAVAAYEALGFRHHHRYGYLAAPEHPEK